MKFLPKTRFEQVDINKETDITFSFMERGRFSSVFDKVYPELRAIQKESKDKNECRTDYKKFLEGIHARDEKQLISAKKQIQDEWEKIGSDFLIALSEHFETDWPADKKEIVGYVSVLPVFPRFLDDYSFFTGYKDIHGSIETSAHEIVHFLWFKKWKEIFPETARKDFENPNLVWRLSEIIDPIILQCNPKIKNLIKPRHWGYKSFESIKIDNIGVIEYFKDIYLKSVDSGDDFAATLKKLWEEAKKHEQEISKF